MAEAVERMIPYCRRHLDVGGRLSAVTRHMVGAFHAVPGARRFRRLLAEGATKPGADVEVIRAALAEVRGGQGDLAA